MPITTMAALRGQPIGRPSAETAPGGVDRVLDEQRPWRRGREQARLARVAGVMRGHDDSRAAAHGDVRSHGLLDQMAALVDVAA